MHRKALLLVALSVWTLLTCAQAQLASLTVQLPPGFNAISYPYDQGGNRLGDLFPVLPDGSALYKLNATTGGYESNTYEAGLGGWQNTTGFTSYLRPGEGAWLYLTDTQRFEFSGAPHVLTPRLDVALPGFNFVGLQKDQLGGFGDVFGFLPREGDEVFLFEQSLAQPPAPANAGPVASSHHIYGLASWDAPPLFRPARGALVYLANQPRVVITPLRRQVAAGSLAQFNAGILNGAASAYQWKFQGIALPGRTNATLVLPNASPAMEGSYTLEAMLGGGAVIASVVAKLAVVLPPTIVRGPKSTTVLEGKPVKFEVTATGTPPLFYRWQREGLALTPFTENLTNFVITNALAPDEGKYSVTVSNLAGQVTSTNANLTVLVPPKIIVPPASQTVGVGQVVTLGVQAIGTEPLLYQWKLNGNDIPGATGPTLTISNLQLDSSGSYRVSVANLVGATNSPPAILTVAGPAFNFSDNFGIGAFLNTASGMVRGNNLNATLQPGEPPIYDKPGGHSVWARYQAPATGIVTFRTRGSTIDTLLGAFRGTSLGNLIEEDSDDDRDDFLYSIISFNVRQGEVFHILMDGFGGARGQIVLSWNLEPTNALLPTILSHPASLTVTQGANASFAVVASGTGGFSYQWFFNQQLISNSNAPTLSITNVQANRIGTYLARVFFNGRSFDSRPAYLEINKVDATGLPANVRTHDKFMDLLHQLDAFGPRGSGGGGFAPASAGLVLGYTGSQAFSTVGSGAQDGEPVHCDVVGGASRWFAYIAPAKGQMFINTDGSNYDTLLAVYSGCCEFEDLTVVECDNNSGTNGLTSSVSFETVSNEVYYIAVDGVNAARGSVKLNYRLFLPTVLTSYVKTSNSLGFRFTATPSYPITVQSTSNFTDWTAHLTTNSPSGSYRFTQTNPPPFHRFYRTTQVP